MLYYKEGHSSILFCFTILIILHAIVKYLSSLKNSCVFCVSNLLTCAQCIQYSSSKHWRKCVKEKCCRYTVWNSLCLPTSILSQKQQISFRKFVLEIYYEVTQGTLKKVLCALCCLISIQIQNYRQSHRNRSSGFCKKILTFGSLFAYLVQIHNWFPSYHDHYELWDWCTGNERKSFFKTLSSFPKEY